MQVDGDLICFYCLHRLLWSDRDSLWFSKYRGTYCSSNKINYRHEPMIDWEVEEDGEAPGY